MRNHQQWQYVVQLVTFSIFILQSLTKRTENVYCRFSVAFLELIFKVNIFYLVSECSFEFWIDFWDLFEIVFALIIKVSKFELILAKVIINFLN